MSLSSARLVYVVLLALMTLTCAGCSLTLDFGKFVPVDGGPEAGASDAAADGG